MTLSTDASHRQNAHLTFQANIGATRHGWLRLTPAYSYRLVTTTLERSDINARIVLDPFSGTGTTGLVSSEQGLVAHLVDVNPFLRWLATVKTRNFASDEILEARQAGHEIIREAPSKTAEGLWQPTIHQIERWWSEQELSALRIIRHDLDQWVLTASALDLLLVAFCRTLIPRELCRIQPPVNVFSRQPWPAVDDHRHPCKDMDVFAAELETVLTGASSTLPGTVEVHEGDARALQTVLSPKVDLLYTSPPYANRISYIRELRPYMYWLRFLRDAKEAGELDWTAIGGTWGIATSRVGQWTAPSHIPLGPDFVQTLAEIRRANDKSGSLLSRYVHKYFNDMWLHFRSAHSVVRPGGKAIYIVGNSLFLRN